MSMTRFLMATDADYQREMRRECAEALDAREPFDNDPADDEDDEEDDEYDNSLDEYGLEHAEEPSDDEDEESEDDYWEDGYEGDGQPVVANLWEVRQNERFDRMERYDDGW